MIKMKIFDIIESAKSNNIEKLKEILKKLNVYDNPNFFSNTFYKLIYLGKCILDYSEIQKFNKITFTRLLEISIENNNLDMVKFLVNETKFKNKIQNIVYTLNYSYKRDNLITVKYLIDDEKMPFHQEIIKELKKRYPKDKNDYLFYLFSGSCAYDNKPCIDYILNHKELKQMINLQTFELGLINACRSQHLELLDYLLTDKKMPFKAYKDYNPEKLLITATIHGHLDILRYLIMDFKIPKNGL